ncbi:hypothetical protein ACJIZ3_004872 [Penstemon smallii]|uniref:Uncharacterized protein n=1 Tax=Penstemon smallii TaxID=265156 RepID=A0ABD3S3E0_9LAMI
MMADCLAAAVHSHHLEQN